MHAEPVAIVEPTGNLIEPIKEARQESQATSMLIALGWVITATLSGFAIMGAVALLFLLQPLR